jgi:hypothetical protein
MRPLDGSGSRLKEKKPADGRRQARLRISPGLPTIPVNSHRFESLVCTIISDMVVLKYCLRGIHSAPPTFSLNNTMHPGEVIAEVEEEQFRRYAHFKQDYLPQ